MNRTTLVVFALFIAGLAVLAVMRSASNERAATERLATLSGESALRQDANNRNALPDVRFEDEKGSALALSRFSGRIILLNVWATWCVPCRKEMPSLDRLQQALGSPRFEVVPLSIDAGGVPVVRRFYDELGLRALRVYVDATSQATADLAILGIPTTLLIDRDRREVWRIAGPVAWDKPEVMERMRREIERE